MLMVKIENYQNTRKIILISHFYRLYWLCLALSAEIEEHINITSPYYYIIILNALPITNVTF